MEKNYLLKGLDCPNCSAKIEKEVGELEGVTSSVVNLMKQTLTISADSAAISSLTKHIEEIVHSHEPDVEVIEQNKPQVTKSYTLKGLDCPNCSAKIEKEVGELEGVTFSAVNLMKQTLTISADSAAISSLTKQIEEIVHSHEPDVEVIEKQDDILPVKNSKTEEKDDSTKKMIVRLSVGAVIYLIGIIASLAGAAFPVVLTLLIIAYIILGYDVVLQAIKNIGRGQIFDEHFLMTVSTIGAFCIGEYPEAVAVMLFYQVGEFFQDHAVKRSRKSISSLLDIRPDTSNVSRNGEVVTVPSETVNIGETIIIKPGEKVPLDGIVIDGETMLDTRALTGESVPRSVHKGETVLSGCINQNSVISVQVTKSFGESTASKIIDMVENASAKKAPTEKFITKFARYYTPVVVIMELLLAVLPPLILGYSWAEWIRRAFVFLIVSCPCALVISIPLTFFGGIGTASKKGVLVKGSNYLEALDSVSEIIFDKTGTLTKGVFNVTEIIPHNDFTQEQILEYASAAENFSNHPIAKSITEAGKKAEKELSVSEHNEISGHGVSAKVNGSLVLAGNEKLMKNNHIAFEESAKVGTKVYVAVDGVYAGCIIISDELKADSKQAIAELKQLGIEKTVMLTGDNEVIGKAVASELGLDEYYSQLLPAHKVEKLEELEKNKAANKKIAFVGDGINDAPVLARADVGIAMGALGSDAAIEAADVVLMTDEPSKLVEAIKVAKATKSIVMQNIVIALGIKAIFLILGAFGIAGMWEAVFGDVGVTMIAVLNSMRIMKK